ncbi:hypothetical protein [Methylocapsa sp. S129]|uniref:hypothetical protein n=1 Tax=Methylocapsa sp. S129 TaxID=1641869 RepID=UPI00131E4832|nr:hypothetical protein [Methylocapsa sp. S129]
MRNIDEILADAQKAMAASLHEAFEAGRAHTASELKTRMAAFFDGLVSADAGAHAAPHPASPANEDHHTDHHHD